MSSAFSFDFDGAGPEPTSLVVGGTLGYLGNELMRGVARFDGTVWRKLGSGLLGSVNAFAVYNGELYAAGAFTQLGEGPTPTPLNNIARWDGSEWRPLGGGILGNGDSGQVLALQVAHGRLYAGGYFTHAGGVAANNIASWDGATWRSLGAGGPNSGGGVSGTVPGNASVIALAPFDGALVVGGRFTTVNGSSLAAGLARFDGTTWSSLGSIAGSGGNDGVVYSIAAFAGPSTSLLYIGGSFSSVGGVAASNIARYARTSTGQGPWMPIAGGVSAPVNDLLLSANAATVTSVYAATSTNVRRFSSGEWSTYAEGGTIMLHSHNGIVGTNRGLSRWDGTRWLNIGPGLTREPNYLIEHQGELFAFGSGMETSTQPLNNVGRLTASGWQDAGAGLAGTYTATGDAVSLGGTLYAILGPAAPVARVKFDGSTWSPAPEIAQVTRFPRLSSGTYAVGAKIWKWNGTTFAEIGTSWPPQETLDLVEQSGELIAIGRTAAYRLVGNAWTSHALFRSGSRPTAVGVWNNRVFIGFTNTGIPASIEELIGPALATITQNRAATALQDWNGTFYGMLDNALCRFDGTTWHTVAQFSQPTYRLNTFQGDLIVPGTVNQAGLFSPMYLRLSCCAADFDDDGVVSIDDIFIFLNAWFAGCNGQQNAACEGRSTDADGNGTLSIDDIFIYLNMWFAGC